MTVTCQWWNRFDSLDANLARLVVLDPVLTQTAFASDGGARTVVVTSATLGKPGLSEAFHVAADEMIVVRAPHIR